MTVLSSMLSPEHISQLKEDLKKWKEIINKKTINVILIGKQPDGQVDTTRRDGLLRMMLVVDELVQEHERSLPLPPPPADTKNTP